MQEFESISASSYDPSALAVKLTAKAAEGWSVVAIVPTGGDVTAFLSRGAAGASADDPTSARTGETAAPVNEPVADSSASTAAGSAEPQAEPVSEPSGWAIAPEPASPANTAAQQTPTYEPTPSYQPTSTYEPTPSYQPAPTPAPEPTVPAGWYADPAGRFELRYWDGTAWTEHVSRAGQQFTDPPVA